MPFSTDKFTVDFLSGP